MMNNLIDIYFLSKNLLYDKSGMSMYECGDYRDAYWDMNDNSIWWGYNKDEDINCDDGPYLEKIAQSIEKDGYSFVLTIDNCGGDNIYLILDNNKRLCNIEKEI